MTSLETTVGDRLYRQIMVDVSSNSFHLDHIIVANPSELTLHNLPCSYEDGIPRPFPTPIVATSDAFHSINLLLIAFMSEAF